VLLNKLCKSLLRELCACLHYKIPMAMVMNYTHRRVSKVKLTQLKFTHSMCHHTHHIVKGRELQCIPVHTHERGQRGWLTGMYISLCA
jgi:ABC-type uncharacterized transport system ATPase component